MRESLLVDQHLMKGMYKEPQSERKHFILGISSFTPRNQKETRFPMPWLAMLPSTAMFPPAPPLPSAPLTNSGHWLSNNLAHLGRWISSVIKIVLKFIRPQTLFYWSYCLLDPIYCIEHFHRGKIISWWIFQ